MCRYAKGPAIMFCFQDLQSDDRFLCIQMEELYILLRDNYVEDDDCMFRFDYSKDFLKWYGNSIRTFIYVR